MPWYPAATRRPIARYEPGGGAGGSMPTPRRLCLHTAVSNADSLYDLFATPGNAVAHFYVSEDGAVEQYVSTDRMASANLEGNHDTISVETWDGYGRDWTGSDVPPWNQVQVEALGKLAAWVSKTHGIPLTGCPSSRPGTKGVAWHRQGIDGNFPDGLLSGRVSGGERWSSSAGKLCPGDARIRQVEQVIKHARRAITPPPKSTPGLDHDIARLSKAREQSKTKPARQALRRLLGRLRALRKERR